MFYKRITLALIDKNSKKIYLSYMRFDKDGRNIIGGIPNNLDGGIDLDPEYYYTENGHEYLVSTIDPLQIKAHISSNNFKNSSPKYPEKKKELEKLANSLKETDNPVLMMVRLKK